MKTHKLLYVPPNADGSPNINGVPGKNKIPYDYNTIVEDDDDADVRLQKLNKSKQEAEKAFLWKYHSNLREAKFKHTS